MPGDGRAREARSPVLQGLRFRVAALLALSLLPIGLVTVLQTRELAAEVENRSELTLAGYTNRAVFGERQVTERVFGAAEALTAVLELVRDDPEACREYLRRYVATSDRLSFVGFLPPDGIVTCSSVDEVIDFSGDPRLEARMAEPRAYVDRIETPGVSGEPVLNVLRPVRSEGTFLGYVTLSVPVAHAVGREDLRRVEVPLSLVTFNRDGEVLFSETGRADEVLLPREVALADLVGTGQRTFRDVDQAGVARSFAVVPIIPELVYSLAAWPSVRGHAGLSPTLLPLLMFVASIAVAYLAVDRLVVRHISALRGTMRDFARGRVLPSARRRAALSTELRELEEGFVDMAIDLANDEARMEDALREKNVLLKEIHHRVKNNLQLISSIMNMQIRAAREEETVSFLRRLQERVLGLAAVHRNLYQAEDLSRTDAGRLLGDLFGQLIELSPRRSEPIAYEGDFENVVLYPDQALPLSLLASELGTNALNHVSSGEGQPCTIAASLARVDPSHAELVCENSVAPDRDPGETAPHGLGKRLIRAFAAQLGGEVRTEVLPGRHRVVLRFRIETSAPTPGDY